MQRESRCNHASVHRAPRKSTPLVRLELVALDASAERSPQRAYGYASQLHQRCSKARTRSRTSSSQTPAPHLCLADLDLAQALCAVNMAEGVRERRNAGALRVAFVWAHLSTDDGASESDARRHTKYPTVSKQARLTLLVLPTMD